MFETEELMLKCMKYLQGHEIFTRRYFYPSLATVLPYLKPKKMPITEDVSRRVLCLPLFHDLSLEEVDLICRFDLKGTE